MNMMTIMWFALEGIDQIAVVGNRMELILFWRKQAMR
jgi:hypothetical protein